MKTRTQLIAENDQLVAENKALRQRLEAVELAIDEIRQNHRAEKEADIRIYSKLQDHDEKFLTIEVAFNIVVSAINRLAFWRNR